PAQERRQGPPNDGSRGKPSCKGGHEISEGFVPFRPFRKNPDEDRKSGYRCHRRSNTLNRSRNDERQKGWSYAACERCDRENTQPTHEDFLLSVGASISPH